MSGKLLIICVILALCLLGFVIFVTPALGYTPPSQGTDNATDVILWYSENLTIESANLTGSVTIDPGTLTIETDLDDTAQDALAFLIVGFIISWVLINIHTNPPQKRSNVLRAIGTAVSVVYGFSMGADYYGVNTSLFIAGIGIGLIGLYFLYSIAADAISRAKEK